MSCVYTFPNGDVVRGKPALKAYLAENLATLLPERAAQAPAFQRTPIQQAIASRVSPEQRGMVERTASAIKARWQNPPDMVVYDGMTDPAIPQAVRDADQRQRSGGATGEPEGFFYQGTAYLSASLASPQDVARVLFHEGLGHYGLRGVFGQTLKPVLDQIVALRKGDVLAKAKAYGLDPKNPTHLLEAAEEVLAEMAQTKPSVGFVQRAIAAIRTWLRQNVPGFGSMQLSDAEIIRDYILPARAFVERGGSAVRDVAAPAMSRSSVFEGIEKPATPLGNAKTVTVDGKERTVFNSEGKPIHPTAEGVRNFWRWFGDSKVVDAEGRPLVVYRSDSTQFNKFDKRKARQGFFFASNEAMAKMYGGESREFYLAIGNPLVVDKALPNEKNATDIKGSEFDGVINKRSDGNEFIAVQPTQIKSATGNNGEYDATNPDIRFKRAPAAPGAQGLTPPEQGLLRRVQSAVQDNMNRVRQVQDRIQKLTGKPLPEHTNYYGAEANRPGRIAARLEDARDKLTAPLMEKLAKSGHTPEELSQLLHAMHAQERNEAVSRINEDMPDGGSGMTTAEAKAIIANFKGNAVLHKLADQARAIAKETLRLKLAYGLINQESFDALDKAYTHYVPLKGDGEYGPNVKRAMGHEEREEHILENISRDYDQAVVSGEKNVARQSLLAMVLENPDPELWTVGLPPRGRFVAGKVYTIRQNGKPVATFASMPQVVAFLEAKGAQAAQFEVVDSNGERVQEFVKPLQDNEVMVYLDGQPVRIQISDEQLARQLRPLDKGQMNPILEAMRGVTRYLSKIYTGYNPAFIIRNTLRDAMTGTVNILGNEGGMTAARAWLNYPSAMTALSVYAATGKEPKGEAGTYLNEYRMHGGKTGASWMSDLEQHGKTLQRMFDDAYGASGYVKDGKIGKASIIAGRKIVGGMAHVIEVMNQATENGLRLSLYMAMRKQGASAGVAAQAAKSVTVDFDRKGSMTGALGAIYLFFNPAVQGTANAIKTLAKGRNKEQAWVALGALAALGMYAALSGIDDDEDRWLGEAWDSRAKNLILKVGDSRIKAPVSMEFAPFYAAGVAMAEAKRGKISPMQAATRLVSSFIDAYFPLQGIWNPESDNPGLDASLAVVPTVLKPGIQIATNRNSFGSQIVPDNEFTKDRPDNLKMFRGTKGTPYDVAAQGIAKAGEALGAGTYENDITKVSPETLKMLWRTYTGGLGQFVTDLGGLGNIAAKDSGTIEAADIPVVKDFVKTNSLAPVRSRYYELTKGARAVSEEFKQAKKAGDDKAMDDILNRPDKAELLGLDRMIRQTGKAAAQIRDQMVDINQDESLPLADKRAQLKALEKEEEALYRDAIGAFKP